MKPALLPWALKGPHDPEILVASSPKFPPLHTPFSHILPGFQIFPWKGKPFPVRRSPSFLPAPFLLPLINFYSSSRYQLRCHSLKPSLIPSSLSLSRLQVWLACVAALMALRAGTGSGLQLFCVPHCPPPTGNQVPCTISPIPACRHLYSFLKLERSCPSPGFLHHLPVLALEIQRCTFEGRSLLPCATCRQLWGSVGSSRAILEAMLPPGGVSRSCGSLRPGAPKPQVWACL